jgi:DNA-binding TFAR19-related protein (PDSD5 family)
LSEDSELNLLMRKKYLEIQRKLMAKTLKEKESSEESKAPDYESIVRNALDSSGLRVLSALKSQYPYEAQAIINALGKAIADHRIPAEISGGELYQLLLSLGIRVRLDTKIYVERKGRVKEFSEYLRDKIKDSQ